MPRLPHGMSVTPDTLQSARDSMAARAAEIPLGFALAQPLDAGNFDFLFLELQEDPANLLPTAGNTRDDLVDLGPVGSTIVAEVLVGLVRRSANSILRADNWQPTLPSARPDRFTLTDLLKFAGVLSR